MIRNKNQSAPLGFTQWFHAFTKPEIPPVYQGTALTSVYRKFDAVLRERPNFSFKKLIQSLSNKVSYAALRLVELVTVIWLVYYCL